MDPHLHRSFPTAPTAIVGTSEGHLGTDRVTHLSRALPLYTATDIIYPYTGADSLDTRPQPFFMLQSEQEVSNLHVF